MLPTEFQVNWPFGSDEEAKNRFSKWPPQRPSWISDRNDFSYFWSISHLDASCKVSSQLDFWFRRRSEKWIFKMAATARDDEKHLHKLKTDKQRQIKTHTKKSQPNTKKSINISEDTGNGTIMKNTLHFPRHNRNKQWQNKPHMAHEQRRTAAEESPMFYRKTTGGWLKPVLLARNLTF